MWKGRLCGAVGQAVTPRPKLHGLYRSQSGSARRRVGASQVRNRPWKIEVRYRFDLRRLLPLSRSVEKMLLCLSKYFVVPVQGASQEPGHILQNRGLGAKQGREARHEIGVIQAGIELGLRPAADGALARVQQAGVLVMDHDVSRAVAQPDRRGVGADEGSAVGADEGAGVTQFDVVRSHGPEPDAQILEHSNWLVPLLMRLQ